MCIRDRINGDKISTVIQTVSIGEQEELKDFIQKNDKLVNWEQFQNLSLIHIYSMTDFELVDELSKLGNVKVPNAIEEIRDAKILHNTVCDVDQMENTCLLYTSTSCGLYF